MCCQPERSRRVNYYNLPLFNIRKRIHFINGVADGFAVFTGVDDEAFRKVAVFVHHGAVLQT